MTVFYNISIGNTSKAKHEVILSFLVTLYMDILIFNEYRPFGTTTKSHKQQPLDLKSKPYFKICAALKICNGSKKFRFHFRKIYSSTQSSPAYLPNLFRLPSPYLMMMKLEWTRMVDELLPK